MRRTTFRNTRLVTVTTLSSAGRAHLIELSIQHFLNPFELSNVPAISDFVFQAEQVQMTKDALEWESG